MVVGIGIDLVDAVRFRRMLGRPQHLIDQVFSSEEQGIFRSRADSAVQVAAAFGIKEAVFKALGQGWLESELFWSDIELLSPFDVATPLVRLRGAVADCCRRLGGDRIVASLSCVGSLVMAQVLIVGEKDGGNLEVWPPEGATSVQ